MLSIPNLFELISAILASIYFRKNSSGFMKYFLAYLWVIVIVELLVKYIHYINQPAGDLYNVYTFFEFNLLFIMYYKITHDKITHKTIKYIAIVFNLLYLLSFFIELIKPTTTVVLGSFFASIIFLLYLREFLYSDEIVNYKKSPYFWITFGMLVYYLGTTPIQSVLNYASMSEVFKIQEILTIFAHICYITGILWGMKKTL